MRIVVIFYPRRFRKFIEIPENERITLHYDILKCEAKSIIAHFVLYYLKLEKTIDN